MARLVMIFDAVTAYSMIYMYSAPCILRPPIHPVKYGLKLKVGLKWRDIYIENIRVVSVMDYLEMQGIVKWRILKSQGPLYI